MRILVTGATGNTGKFVLQELVRMGEQVIAAGTDLGKLRRVFGDEMELVEFDFTRPETFQEALKDVDRIFLMRPPHLGNPEDLYPFLREARKHPIRLLTFLSLMGIEKNTIPPHHKIEKFIEELGIAHAHIRPGFFMQNLSGIHAQEIRLNDEVFIPAGKSRTSFIDASDLGLAIATILHCPELHQSNAYTLTGGESLNYYEVAEVLSRVTKRKITYTRPGLLRYRHHCIHARGLDKKYVNVTLALYLMTRLGTASKVTDDFFRLTGRKPVTFEEFAMKNIQAFSTQ